MNENSQKFSLISLLGVLVCGALLFVSYQQSAVLAQLGLALLAAAAVYAGFKRKIDFNDSGLYLCAVFFVVVSFALEELLLENNANLALYASAYALGSVPFGLLLAKIFANVDIKDAGSKSIGATNVLRVVKEKNIKLAKTLAVATFACDFLKAFLPILALKLAANADIAVLSNTQFPAMLYSVGVFAVLGHCFSLYLGGEGGKGVATAAGVMGVLLPLELAIGLAAWFVVGKVFKISSVASLAGLIAFLIALFTIASESVGGEKSAIIVICLIIIYKHIPNIKRLLSKKECKVV